MLIGVVASSQRSTTVPGQVTGVSTTPSSGQVALTWTAPASTGGSAITDYVVEFSSNAGASWSTFADGTSTLASATVTGLANGTSYLFRVSAVNAVGTGAPSASASATPAAAATAPGAPTAIVGAVASVTSMTVTWTAPASTGGSAITDYVVQSSPDGTTWTTFADGTSTLTSATVTGLTTGSTYQFRVAAVNAIGTGANGTASTGVLLATAPATPASPSATAGNAQATVAWTAPAANGSAITGYQIQQAVSPFTTWTNSTGGAVSGATLTATVTGLTNGTGYQFRVAATNAIGTATSPASTTATPTAGATVPGAPTGVAATPGNSKVTVTWTAPASTGGSAITGYRLEASLDSGVSWIDLGNIGTTPPYVLTALPNGSPIRVRLFAVNVIGESAASTATPDVTPTIIFNVFAVGNQDDGCGGLNGQVGVRLVGATPTVSASGPSNIVGGVVAGATSLARGGSAGGYVYVNEDQFSCSPDSAPAATGWTTTAYLAGAGRKVWALGSAGPTGLFVAAWSSSATTYGIHTSTDGITWTPRTAPAAGALATTFSIVQHIYRTGQHILLVNLASGIAVWTSSDGITWASTTVATGTMAARGIAYNGTTLVIVGYQTGVGQTWTTTNPTGTWTQNTLSGGALVALTGVAPLAAAGVSFVAVSTAAGNVPYTSANGVTWTARTPATGSTSDFPGGGFMGRVVAGDGYVAWPSSAAVILTTDGITYTRYSVGADTTFKTAISAL